MTAAGRGSPYRSAEELADRMPAASARIVRNTGRGQKAIRENKKGKPSFGFRMVSPFVICCVS